MSSKSFVTCRLCGSVVDEKKTRVEPFEKRPQCRNGDKCYDQREKREERERREEDRRRLQRYLASFGRFA